MRKFDKGSFVDWTSLVYYIQLACFTLYFLYLFVFVGIRERNFPVQLISLLGLLFMWAIYFLRSRAMRSKLLQTYDCTDFVREQVLKYGEDPLEAATIDGLIDEWCALHAKQKNALSYDDIQRMGDWVYLELERRKLKTGGVNTPMVCPRE